PLRARPPTGNGGGPTHRALLRRGREQPLRSRRHDDHPHGSGPRRRSGASRNPTGGSARSSTRIRTTGNSRRAAGRMMRPRDPEATTNFFRTELGKTLRVDETDEGAISVDILKDGVWSEAPPGTLGLRLSPGSRGLPAAEILAVPT